MISIINYGVGNLLSIKNMFRRLGSDVNITEDADTIAASEKLILPGVGAFDNCMAKFSASGLREIVEKKAINEKTPTLGICVGLQMMTRGSDEGKLPGLGWVAGETVKFDVNRLESFQRIPHMGWSEVRKMRESMLLDNFDQDARFYFVHSYHVRVNNPEDELLSCRYGYAFTAAIECGNILGVQFHPEKSHRYGMRLFENFVKNY